MKSGVYLQIFSLVIAPYAFIAIALANDIVKPYHCHCVSDNDERDE